LVTRNQQPATSNQLPVAIFQLPVFMAANIDYSEFNAFKTHFKRPKAQVRPPILINNLLLIYKF